MVKAVIFDMDGLMIDSERVTFEGYKKVMESMGYIITEEFYKTVLGITVREGGEKFRKKYGENFPFEKILAQVHKYMENVFDTEGVPVKKGLLHLLQFLKKNNYKTVVATSSDRKRVDKILKNAKLDDYFDASICGDEVICGKPNPEVFLRACEKIGIMPEEALVLEDSEAGIMAANAGKIKVICIPDMKYPKCNIAKLAYKIMNDLDEVKLFMETL